MIDINGITVYSDEDIRKIREDIGWDLLRRLERHYYDVDMWEENANGLMVWTELSPLWELKWIIWA